MQFNIPVGVTSQLEGLGDHNELPQQGPSPKTNLLHSGAVKKPSVDIIFTVINAHTHIHKVLWPLSRLTWVSRWPPLSILLNLFRFNASSRH